MNVREKTLLIGDGGKFQNNTQAKQNKEQVVIPVNYKVKKNIYTKCTKYKIHV